jgi:flagellar export protein FliJ
VKKYRFRLETVLNVRTTQEDLARAALAQANLRVSHADASLASRMSRYSSMAMAGGVRSTTDFMQGRFVHELAALSVREAEIERDAANQAAAERRAAWSAAAKEVSVLERLDERRRAEHELAAAREADVEVDDLVVGRFGRETPGLGGEPA